MLKKILSLPKFILKLIYIFTTIVALISVMLFIGIYWLSSDDGQNYVQKLIKDEFSNKVGYQIQADGVDFHFPFNAKISNLSLKDRQGKWLEIKNISINILLNPNIRKHLIITNFSIDKFSLLRSPIKEKSNSINALNNVEKNKKEILESKTSQDFKISIKGIDIKEIILASSLINYSSDINFSVSGSLLWDNLSHSLTFDNIIKLKKMVQYVGPVKVKLSGKYISNDINNKFDKIMAEINTGRIEVTLPSSLGDISKLNSKKSNSTKEVAVKNNKSSKTEQSKSILLDVKLKVDNNVYIKGFGLDIVMGGDLKITGDINNPKVRGKLGIVDGIFSEFGNIFKIKKADLLFDGDIPPYPYLEVVGSINQAGIEIMPILSGPILSPSFTIKSSPSLNSKEIISKLLFGEDLSKISSDQAKKLIDSLKNITINNDSAANAIKSLFNQNKTKGDANKNDSNIDTAKDIKNLLEKKLKFKF